MRNRGQERGVALVVVLLLLAVMSILVAEFAYAVRIQASLLANHEARIQGRAAARAGQNAAAAILLRTKPDEPSIFNNPMTGIMLFRYKCMTSGNTDSFLSIVGGASFDSLTADERAKAAAPSLESGGTASQEGCGEWSLGLPYQLGDANLDIDIADEQARLNLNAMDTAKVNTANGVSDVEFSFNRPYFCAVYELIRLQVMVHKLQIADPDILDMTTAILDYLDYGKIDGAFDRDKITTFEIGTTFVPMKDGPLDTVDEIRLVPGMTDELYNAVKDFFTVYPVIFDPANPTLTGFSQEINLNEAPLEVVYALIRSSASSGDRCESTIPEDQAMKLANQFIQSNYPGGGTAATGGSSQPAGATYQFNRDTSPLPPTVTALNVKPNGGPRFFRVKVSAMMPDGQETIVTRVVKTLLNQSVQPLYYREE